VSNNCVPSHRSRPLIFAWREPESSATVTMGASWEVYLRSIKAASRRESLIINVNRCTHVRHRRWLRQPLVTTDACTLGRETVRNDLVTGVRA